MARRRRQTTIGAVMIAIALVALGLGSLVDPISGLIGGAIFIEATAMVVSIVVATLFASSVDRIGRFIHRPRKKR